MTGHTVMGHTVIGKATYAVNAMPTLGEALARGRAALAAAGIDSAALDGRVLLEHAAACSTADIVGHPERPLAPDQASRFDDMIRRRAAREPVAQILKTREFWSLPFEVSRDTLTPRPDSETLIEAVLDCFDGRESPRTVLDLGTGSGCLLLSVLHTFPAARGIGVDISHAALELARRNAAALGLADRAAFVCGDWADALTDSFDLIVCNPPYVSASEWHQLEPEVREFEPRAALVAGADGLDAYRRLIPVLASFLNPTGVAALEIGEGQWAPISALFNQCGMTLSATRRDLADVDRCILATVACR